MKNLCAPEIAKYRDDNADKLYGTTNSERATGGAFLIPSVRATPHLTKRVWIRVVASSGEGWDHVSVSLSNRTPTWEEMDFIKRLFFERDETAMQLHVPSADHINNMPYCLHLWRPHKGEIPRPPADMVGLPGVELQKEFVK